MASTSFTNGVTLSDADWFNDLNRLHYTILSDPADAAAVRNAISLGTSNAVTFGGVTSTNGAKLGNGTRDMFFTADSGGVALTTATGATGHGWYFDAANSRVQLVITSALQNCVFTSTGLNNCAVGSTTAAAGAFTSLSATGTVTLNGGVILVGQNSSQWGSTAIFESFGTNKTSAFVNATAATTTVGIWNQATAGDNVFVQFATEAGASTRGTIDFNRAGTAVRYNTSSDERLKENIVDATYDPSWLSRIRVREFDWKESGYHAVGLIAQELVTVEPDAVSVGDENRDWAVDPSKLIYKLLLEVQELRKPFYKKIWQKLRNLVK